MSGMKKGTGELKAIYDAFDEREPSDPIDKYNPQERHRIFKEVDAQFNFDGAESDLDLENRANDIMDTIIGSGHKKIIVVSHGGILSAVIRRIMNISWVPHVDSGNCWVCYVTYDPTINRYRLNSPPNRDHLKM